jgi:hypothetical protein
MFEHLAAAMGHDYKRVQLLPNSYDSDSIRLTAAQISSVAEAVSAVVKREQCL